MMIVNGSLLAVHGHAWRTPSADVARYVTFYN
jgi:hypothetical protein